MRGYVEMRFFSLMAGLVLSASAVANTSNGYNLPPGVTSLSQGMYSLHMEVFWICVGIAVVVFGAMIYSLVKFRRSQGAIPDTTMVHSTKVEIIWTVIPVIILVVMAIPAADLILKQEDTRNSELSVRVTGYQWKWQYTYMDAGEGVDFFSTLKQDSNFARQLGSGIDPTSVENYLLEVDHPLVVPSGTKVRLLLTVDGCHPRLVGSGFRRQALGHSGLRERTVVQGGCRQGRHLPGPVRRALRPGSRLHAGGGRRAHAG